MGTIREKFLAAAEAVKFEFFRLDRTCNNCNAEIFGGETPAERFFCPDCAAKLPFNDGYICARCGRSAVEPCASCDACSSSDSHFKYARSSFYYAYPVDKAVRNLKFSGKKYLAEVYAQFLKDTYLKYFSGADAFAFSPMTRRSKRRRGYNQAEQLARELTKLVGVPTLDVLVKSRETESQSRLGRAERFNNLKNAIKAGNRALIEGKRIVFIDDIMTSGATAEACAEQLMKAGASEVCVLTLATVTDKAVAGRLGQRSNSWVKGNSLRDIFFRTYEE